MGKPLSEDDLLPTEELLMTKLANMWVKPSAHGLSKFAFGKYLGDNESIGGNAFLTNYRIIFKSHAFNRLTGKHSIFLPNICEIRKRFLGITVVTESQEYKFVMWFTRKFIDAVNDAKDALNRKKIDKLCDYLTDYPERIGKGLQKNHVLENINKVVSGAMKLVDVLANLTSPEQSTVVEILTLFSGND